MAKHIISLIFIFARTVEQGLPEKDTIIANPNSGVTVAIQKNGRHNEIMLYCAIIVMNCSLTMMQAFYVLLGFDFAIMVEQDLPVEMNI